MVSQALPTGDPFRFILIEMSDGARSLFATALSDYMIYLILFIVFWASIYCYVMPSISEIKSLQKKATPAIIAFIISFVSGRIFTALFVPTFPYGTEFSLFVSLMIALVAYFMNKAYREILEIE